MITNLDEINQKLDPIDVLKAIGYEKSRPKRSGGEIRDFCPIHKGDNQQSLAINAGEHLFQCHSCSESGNLISLYAKAMNCNLPQAVEELAKHFHLQISYETPQLTKRQVNNHPTMSVEEAWNKAKEGDGHPYLEKKKVSSCPGLKYSSDIKGNSSIVVPFRDLEGKLQTIQYVHSGGKFFLKDAPVNRAFFSMGDISQAKKVYVSEGLATGLTIWEAEQRNVCTISCGSCGNIPHVVEQLRSRYKDLTIIVCLDNNSAALKAAQKIKSLPGISFRKPTFEGLPNPNNEELADFNDLISKCGLGIEIVAQQLQTPYKVPELDLSPKENPSEKLETTDNLTHALEEKVIAAFINRSFEEIVESDLDINLIDASIFTGNTIKKGKERASVNRALVNAIIDCWQEGLCPNIENIAIKCEHSDDAYQALKRISTKPVDQIDIEAYLKKICNDQALEKIQQEFTQAKIEGIPFQDLSEKLRKALDTALAKAAKVTNQEQSLGLILNDIITEKTSTIPTGIVSIDQLLNGGFYKATVNSMTGGAGAGKTALALQIADSIAAQGNQVLYISMEIKRSKLTERSLKRIYYTEYVSKSQQIEKEHRMNKTAEKYREFCQNIRIVEGFEGMTLAELRSHILGALDHAGKEMLVIIDPFQRLSTGDYNLDATNETLKVNKLCSSIKRIANDCKIPILMLSDTVKAHKTNQSGEGSARGSYMIDHIVDCNMMIRSNKNDPLLALFGEIGDREKQDIIFFEEIKENIERFKNAKCKNLNMKEWDKWASVVTSKQRDGLAFNPLLIYRTQYYYFEDTKVTEKVIKQEDIF